MSEQFDREHELCQTLTAELLEYREREARLRAAMDEWLQVSTPEQATVEDWLAPRLEQARAQERERCLTRRYPIPFRAMEAVLTVYLPSEEDRVVREWLDNIAAAIREADDAD